MAVAIEARNDSPDYYVKRNLSLSEFAEWARGTLPDSVRLRSVVGPPGSGKSTFLRQLGTLLGHDEVQVVWFDLAALDKDPANRLHDALDAHAQEWKMSFVSDRSVQFAAAFDAFTHSLVGQLLILLIDSFEEVDQLTREEIEAQVLVPFLFPPGQRGHHRRAVIARRDEYGLREALLRWEEDVYVLEGLNAAVRDGPQEQIRRRLVAVVGNPANAEAILGWERATETDALPNEALDFICHLDEAGVQAFSAEFDSPNPYLNLSLLQQKLRHWRDPLSDADYRAALAAYMHRAGLPNTYFDKLIDLVPRLDKHDELSLSEYRGVVTRAAELEALMAAGVIIHRSPNRYRVEPALVRALQQLQLSDAHADAAIAPR